MALIDAGGRLYTVGFSLLRYGDRWLLESQDSPCAATAPSGAAVETSRAEYERLTNG